MPTIILNEIECFRPTGGTRDDVMLTLMSDEIRNEVIWQPRRMRKGDRIDLGEWTDPIEYDDFARISLYEHDLWGRNDFLWRVNFSANPSVGTFDYYFPSELNARYRLNVTVQAEPVTLPDCIISPRSLTCNDAQGARDEVTLYVNDHIILGPTHEMRRNRSVDFTDLEIRFRSCCEVRLKDTQGQDWSRSFFIRAGDYEVGSDLDHVFVVSGRDVVGDARYTFVYRMLA